MTGASFLRAVDQVDDTGEERLDSATNDHQRSRSQPVRLNAS